MGDHGGQIRCSYETKTKNQIPFSSDTNKTPNLVRMSLIVGKYINNKNVFTCVRREIAEKEIREIEHNINRGTQRICNVENNLFMRYLSYS